MKFSCTYSLPCLFRVRDCDVAVFVEYLHGTGRAVMQQVDVVELRYSFLSVIF